MTADPAERLDFLRAAHGEALSWYRSAEAKGQVLLTVDGIIITVLAGAVFGDPAEVGARAEVFDFVGWALLGLTSLALLGSLMCAVMCLRSRLNGPAGRVTAGAVWWFGGLARMGHDEAVAMLRAADRRLEGDALAEQLPVLARNVLAKHRWVNAGWALTAVALAALMAAAADYLVRL